MLPLFINRLSKRLGEQLPGEAAHKIMMIESRSFTFTEDKKKKPAAVLILLYPIDNEWYFFLTKRTNIVEHHKGQISLPGGMIENNESYKNAALRETHEEIGVASDEINILKKISEWPKCIEVASIKLEPHRIPTVSYTHLTLPTKRIV